MTLRYQRMNCRTRCQLETPSQILHVKGKVSIRTTLRALEQLAARHITTGGFAHEDWVWV